MWLLLAGLLATAAMVLVLALDGGTSPRRSSAGAVLQRARHPSPEAALAPGIGEAHSLEHPAADSRGQTHGR